VSGTRTAADRYIDAVSDDIAEQTELFNVNYIPGIYIGGGTPSAPGAERITRLLSAIKTLLKKMNAPPREFTVEANPESADEAFFRACAEGGVSRISLGVQSFHEAARKAVRREGGPEQLEKALALAARFYPNAFSADLIAGLPFQTETVIKEDVGRLLPFGPAHVSLYGLILEPRTPLGKKAAAGEIPLPPPDEADGVWIAGRDMLESSGYRQYEVSNFCLPGKACAHNIRYWRMENWLGAGPAASGTIVDEETGKGKRYSYPPDIESYLGAPSPKISRAVTEELSREDLVKETLLMGFRYSEGPDGELFKRRFGVEIADLIPKTAALWRGRGFFQTGPGLKPSKQGLLFVNGFLRDAFAELERTRDLI